MMNDLWHFDVELCTHEMQRRSSSIFSLLLSCAGGLNHEYFLQAKWIYVPNHYIISNHYIMRFAAWNERRT